MIIAGDINERVGSLDPNYSHRIASFDDIFEAKDIIILNDGSPTRFQLQEDGNNQISAIDGTFVSAELAERCISWAPLMRLSSDHLPVVTTIQISTSLLPLSTKIGSVNWKKAIKNVKRIWSETPVSCRADSMLKIIQESVRKAERPKSTKKTRNPDVRGGIRSSNILNV